MTSFVEYAAKSNPELSSQLEEKRKSLVVILSLWQLGFTSLVFVVCIFFSHKIAGPIYKMQKFLRAIRDGLDYGTLFFRKGDYFSELADDFNETFEQIKEDYKKDFVYISEVNAYLNNLSMVVPDDKKIVLKEITQRLSEIQERFNSK
jgi:sensor histidine kinase YesM